MMQMAIDFCNSLVIGKLVLGGFVFNVCFAKIILFFELSPSFSLFSLEKTKKHVLMLKMPLHLIYI